MNICNLKDSLFSYINKARNQNDIFINEELKKRGITGLVYSHIRIIILLSIYEKLSMKEISEKISRDKSTVTILVNKLQKLGYIQKEVGVEDKRVIYLTLKEKSNEIISTIIEVSNYFEKRVEEVLTIDEKNMLLQLMQKLINNF